MFFSRVSGMQKDTDELCSLHKVQFLYSLHSSSEECMEPQMI